MDGEGQIEVDAGQAEHGQRVHETAVLAAQPLKLVISHEHIGGLALVCDNNRALLALLTPFHRVDCLDPCGKKFPVPTPYFFDFCYGVILLSA